MIAASLILDFTGIECTYGNIPNIPQEPDPRIEEIVFDKESDCQLLEDWLEKQLAGKLPHPKFTRTSSALSKKLATAVGGYRMVRNILDLCKIADDYIAYLKDKGMKFGEDGFPVFSQQMFLDDLPEQVIPYDFRKNRAIKNPTKTLLCFYCPDARIYPRLEQVLDDIAEYRKYMGAVATDVTMTCDMDEEWQDFIMLLNQLFMAVLAVNRIKIVANLRTGNLHTHGNFKGIPANIMWAAGFLGCARDKPCDMRFISTVLLVRPSKPLIYGKEDKNAIEKLSLMGIEYSIYPDYHKICKEAA